MNWDLLELSKGYLFIQFDGKHMMMPGIDSKVLLGHTLNKQNTGI